MSRYFNSFMDDSNEALEHSWGTSPKAKAREKEYNHWYYQKHKDDLAEVRKRKRAATNYYKQAQKSHDDSLRYKSLANKMYDKYTDLEYSGHLKRSDVDMLDKAQKKYIKDSQVSESKSRKLRFEGDTQRYWAKVKSESILQHIKNPTVKDLVEFYLDTTVSKAKKSANKAINKAKKYATKAMSSAEKAAKKYATEAMSTAEKSARKAKKYATKTIKSVVR